MVRSLLYLTIKFSNISSTLACIQLSSASINTDTLFFKALSQIKLNLFITLPHSIASLLDNFLLLETFSYNLNSPIAVGLKTMKGKLLLVFNLIRFKVLKTVLSKLSLLTNPSTE